MSKQEIPDGGTYEEDIEKKELEKPVIHFVCQQGSSSGELCRKVEDNMERNMAELKKLIKFKVDPSDEIGLYPTLQYVMKLLDSNPNDIVVFSIGNIYDVLKKVESYKSDKVWLSSVEEMEIIIERLRAELAKEHSRLLSLPKFYPILTGAEEEEEKEIQLLAEKIVNLAEFLASQKVQILKEEGDTLKIKE
ncbi:MAG: hypothetical protein WC659_04925 [Patescibacteria group bacterium]